MKICIHCNIEKNLDEFHKASQNKDGKENRCRSCILKMKSKNYFKNHEINREKARLKALEFRKNNKGYQRKYDLKRIYGITLEDYNAMLFEQNNCCKICKSPNAGGKNKIFYVDHCHKNGNIRGLLCTGCNLALGGFRDNIDTLYQAIDYLKQNTAHASTKKEQL